MSFNSSSKEYREIYVAKKKPEGRLKGDRERKYDTKGKEKNYVYAHLNIGKKELLRPQILVSLAGRVAGVRKENIGDIVIRKSGTDLEITRQGFNYLMKLQGHEYNGTIIKVSKIKSM